MPAEPLIERVRRLLGSFPSEHGFAFTSGDDQANPFGAWVRLDSDEFWVGITRDRGDEWMTVGTKVRPKRHAPLR
jgi:hypothetical protein